MIILNVSSLNGSFSFSLINLKLLLKKISFFSPKINDQFKRFYTPTKLFWGSFRWRKWTSMVSPLTKHRWLFKTLVSTFLLITSLTCYSGSVWLYQLLHKYINSVFWPSWSIQSLSIRHISKTTLLSIIHAVPRPSFSSLLAAFPYLFIFT